MLAVGADRIPVTCKPVRPSGWQQQQPRFARIPRRPSWARAAAEPATATADSSVADSAVSTYLSGSTSASSTAGQGPEWQACVQRLQCMGFSDQDAERFVQRAFGWGPKAKSYWRHEKSEQPADLQQLETTLQFLVQLGLSDEQVAKVVKAFPEVLGCDVQQQLQGNVDKLQADWKLQGCVLVKAVLRQPAVLGYNLDCMGDCAGECNRCWVRF